MPGNIGPLEIGVVLIVALLVFGPKRLPELGSGLGRGIREFKESITGERRDELDSQSAASVPDERKAGTTPTRPDDTSSRRS
jgi:sec-independent protein translocase protein TatA